MFLNPIHWLPLRLRAGAYLVGAGLWSFVFAYGTVRLLLEREWAYAAAAAVMLLLLLHNALRAFRFLKASQAEDPAAEHRQGTGYTPDPIE